MYACRFYVILGCNNVLIDTVLYPTTLHKFEWMNISQGWKYMYFSSLGELVSVCQILFWWCGGIDAALWDVGDFYVFMFKLSLLRLDIRKYET